MESFSPENAPFLKMETGQLFATPQKYFPNFAFPLISHLSPSFSPTVKFITTQSGEHSVSSTSISTDPSPLCRSPTAVLHPCPQELPARELAACGKILPRCLLPSVLEINCTTRYVFPCSCYLLRLFFQQAGGT